MRTAIVIPCAIFLLISSSAYSATWHIPDQCPTIQSGIDSASFGDTVLVACGTYYEHSLFMKSGLCLRSKTGQPDCVTIDAAQLGRVLHCSGVDAHASVQGFTFTGGVASDYGGGIRCDLDSSLRIVNCVFLENEATHGAGIYCSAASPSLVQCAFFRNVAETAGGAVYSHNSFPTLTNCTLFANDAGTWTGTGSGIYASGGYPTIENTIIAFGTTGAAVTSVGGNCVGLRCCTLYGNAGGDWVGCIADQYGINGNISADPLFCDPDNGNFYLQCGSPCAAFTSPNPECDLIGAWPVGCGGTVVEGTSWSSLKALYR